MVEQDFAPCQHNANRASLQWIFQSSSLRAPDYVDWTSSLFFPKDMSLSLILTDIRNNNPITWASFWN